jgi:predicted DNA-binding transcriptional regulator AlpA
LPEEVPFVTIELRQAALESVRVAAIQAYADGELPIFLGELELVRMEILVSATTRAAQPLTGSKKDRVLSVNETAKRIGRSRWWIYANKDALPIVRLPTGRYGFSERALERWIERRASA